MPGARRSDEHIIVTIPPEQRWEHRVPLGHTKAEWIYRREEYNQRCAYCGIHKDQTISKHLFREHVNPVSRGGTDHISNIVPACWICNGRKGSARPGERSIDGATIPQPRIRKRHRPW